MWDRIRKKMKQVFTLKNLLLAGLLLALGYGAFYSLDELWEDNKKTVHSELKHYQNSVIQNEAELLSAQLVAYVTRGSELARSRIFRSAVEGFNSRDKKEAEDSHEDFKNFVKASGFIAGYLFEKDGTLLAASVLPEVAVPPRDEDSINKVLSSRASVFKPLRNSEGALVADLYLPVFPAYAKSAAVEPERVLVLSIPMNSVLRSFLSSQDYLEYDSRIHLIQQRGEQAEEIVFTYPDRLKLQTMKASFKNISSVPFGIRTGIDMDGKVYSSALLIPAIHWWVMIETGKDRIDLIFSEYRTYSAIIIGLGFGLLVFFALTLRFLNSTSRLHAKSSRLEEELKPLKKQASLLKRVSSALPEPVSLKKSETGEYVFCNQAFSDFVRIGANEIKGLTDSRVFDSDEAETLGHGDQMVAMSGSEYTHEMVMTRGSRKLTMQIECVPCNISSDEEGVLTVYRDVTDEKSAATKSIEVRQQVIDALVRAVENVPFLDGHTSLMRTMAIEIAEALLLSDAEVATVEAAAILSQVGKTFVPKEIMEKEGKLTPEEILETQKYIEHTCNILEGIKFDLPITQTIWQMQETLDGTGYPYKLEGREITMLARILGVTNTFSALVQKRSYRKAKTAHEAVEILQSMADKKYDSSVIDALGAVIDTQAGREILQANNVDF